MEGTPTFATVETTVPPGANIGIRSLLLQLALVIVVLGVPILGTSYFFVSQVSTAIATVTTERETLVAFDSIARLFPLLEAFHRRVEVGSSQERTGARDAIDRAIADVERAYERSPMPSDARESWNRFRSAWSRARHDPLPGALDRLQSELSALALDLENDSPVDYDPSDAIQTLAALLFREDPRSIAAIRQTVDATEGAPRETLDVRAIEPIATGRALELQPLALAAGYMRAVVALDPRFVAAAEPLAASASRRTDDFQNRIERILKTATLHRSDAIALEASAQQALDLRERLWTLDRREAGRLVLQRLDAAVVQRRVMIAYAFLAVLIGTLIIVSIGRYILRRGEILTATAELERDKLRAELAQVSMQRALRLQEAQFRTVFDNTHLGIVIYDERGEIAQYNAAVDRIFGPSTRAVLENQQSELRRFASPNCAPFTLEKRCTGADGEMKSLELTYSGQYTDGVCQLVVLLVRDATTELALRARLLYEANHDSLTNIANRAAFEAALRRQLERAEHQPFALVYLDLDHFKPINDTYGHAAGDHVLMTTAARLVAALGSDDSCARLGGDEFAVLIRGVDDRQQLSAIAARLLAGIVEPIAFGDLELRVTASIGLAMVRSDHASASMIKHEADRALYTVKERGRNGYLISDRGVLAISVAESRVMDPSC